MRIVNRMMQGARDLVRGFASDSRGNVAMISAFVIPLLLLITFGGIDIHRASTVKANLQDALDAATLAAARSPYTDDANITRVGLASLQANLAPFKDITLVTTATTFRLDTSTGAVIGDTKVDVKAIVGAIVLPRTGAATAGTIPVGAHSEVLRSNNRIEVALVIDNTGSMQGTKLTNTKNAATDLINRLEAADARSIEPDAIKISLVPFSMTVRIVQGGTSSYPNYMSNALTHTGGTGTTGLFATPVGRFTLFQNLGTTWGGCVESRPQPYDIRDTAPSSLNQDTMFVPYFAPDEPDADDYPRDSTWNSWLNSSNSDLNDYVEDGPTSSGYYPFGTNTTTAAALRLTQFNTRLKLVSKYSTARKGTLNTNFGPNHGCSLQPIIRLTDNYDQLRTAVSNMVATGNTNVPLGAMWGWHTLSPNAPFGDGRAYGSERLQKIIIIMTDGENVMTDTNNPNDSYYNGLGYIWQGRLGMTSGSDSQRRTAMDYRFDHPTAGTEDMCGNMKDKNIEVYTIAVQVDAAAQTVLRRCASDDDHYFPVNSASGIGDAFDRIAGAIENLRISR